MPDVPYSLLRTLRACLDGTADQPAWDRAKDELDDLLLAEPDLELRAQEDHADAEQAAWDYWVAKESSAAACSLCEAGHVPLRPCGGSVPAVVDYADGFVTGGELTDAMNAITRPGPEGDGDPC